MRAFLVATTLLVCAISMLAGCRAEGEVGDVRTNVAAGR